MIYYYVFISSLVDVSLYQIHTDIDIILLTHCKLCQEPFLPDPYHFILDVIPNIRRLILTCR